MHFPIWKHHAEHGEKLVKTQEELASLGEGWSDDSGVWRKHLLTESKAVEVVAEVIEEKLEEQKVEEIAEVKASKKSGKKASK